MSKSNCQRAARDLSRQYDVAYCTALNLCRREVPKLIAEGFHPSSHYSELCFRVGRELKSHSKPYSMMGLIRASDIHGQTHVFRLRLKFDERKSEMTISLSGDVWCPSQVVLDLSEPLNSDDVLILTSLNVNRLVRRVIDMAPDQAAEFIFTNGVDS